MGATVTGERGRSRPMPLENRLKTSSAAAAVTHTKKAMWWRTEVDVNQRRQLYLPRVAADAQAFCKRVNKLSPGQPFGKSGAETDLFTIRIVLLCCPYILNLI